MNPSQGVETIFAQALSLPPEQRAAYLVQFTHGNPELRRRVESLLQSYEDGNFLEGAASPQLRDSRPTTVSVTEKPGDTIGRYKLLQQVGEGGCGVVYMAEQVEPVRRRVALKIIKLGMDTRSVIARFEAERQALAMMDHLNIAKVLDAGATATGRPYFVMELVRGVKITEYCDEAKLSMHARLHLFIQVCAAIQHAHQKGIIHRDIKPSNILVSVNDGVAVPKVIDFGIAKATGGQLLTDKTVFTAFEQFIGTPAYMSPEQALISNVDIDTRSDIYALGVLLYELLTGKTPFNTDELLDIGLDEMRRTIREQEPPRPSTRLSTLPGQDLSTTAQRRGLEAPKLVTEVRGDLDWIVMKCIEKDRSRRYETANGLIADIHRHLNNEPVAARPPSKLYRLGKTVRRNKLGFTAAAAVTAALVTGLGVSSWMFLKEKDARARAVTAEQQANRARVNESLLRQQAEANEKKASIEAQKNRQVTHFLEDMLKGVGPSVALGRDTRMLREILDKTADRVSKDLQDQPDVEAEIVNDIGEVYHALGQYEKAEQMHRRALATLVSLRGREHLDVARSLHNLGATLRAELQQGGAEVAYRDALQIRKKLLGNEHVDVADSLSGLGMTRQNRGYSSEAETFLREALAMKQKLLPPEHPSIAASLFDLGQCLLRSGKSLEAEPLLREALAIQRKVWGNDDLRVASVLGKLGVALANQGNLVEAKAVQQEALVRNRTLFGREHPAVADSLGELALVLQRQGSFEGIEALFREELANARERYPAYAAPRSDGIYRLLEVLLDRHEFTVAEQLINELLTPAILSQPRNAGLLFDRAQFFARRNRRKDATVDFSRVVELDPANQASWYFLAMLLAECGESDTYQRHCRKMIARFSQTEDPLVAEKTAKASLLLSASGDDLEAAAKIAKHAVTIGANHSFLPYLQLAMGMAEYRRRNFERAQQWLEESLSHGWEDQPNFYAPAHLMLAMTLLQLGHPDKAQSELSQGNLLVLKAWPDSSSGDLGPGWYDALIARILLREAKTLIEAHFESSPETSE
jgi:serine/threonine protein kinase/tetratricopeptide (TPR) repeat protein